MRHVVRYRPTNSVNLFSDFDSVFDKIFSGNTDYGYNSPAVDVRENKDNYLIEADLPGLTEKQIDVKIENDILTLSAEVEAAEEKEYDGYLVKERKSRSFSRSFALPKDVNREAITAEFDSGVLKLQMPKLEEAKPKSISIKVKEK